MNNKILAIMAAITFAIGMYAGKIFYGSNASESHTSDSEQIRKDITTVTEETTKPDGSRSTRTVVTDRSKESKESTSSVTLAAPPPNWTVGLSYSVAPSSGSYAPIYGLQVERRILGPFKAGVRVQSDKQIGLVVAYEF